MKSLKFQVAVLVLISFALGCSEFIVVGILSDIATGLGVSIVRAGHLVTLFALVYALVTPFIATFLGRFRHYYALLALSVIFVLGNLLSSISPNYTFLLFSRLLTAVVSGPMISLGFTFANILAPPAQKARIVSYVFSGFSIASVFGVPLGTWISAQAGWRAAFAAITVLSVLTLLLCLLALPREVRSQVTGIKGQLKIFTDRRIQIGILLPLFSAAGFYTFYTYLRPILSDQLKLGVKAVSLVLFAYGLTAILSNLLSGRLAAVSGLKLMPAAFTLQAVLFLLLLPAWKYRNLALVLIMVLGVTMYLLNSPIQMHFFSVAEDDYPQSMVLASSFNSIFFNFGISLGSFVGSQIVAWSGIPYVGIGAAVLALVTVLLLALLNLINRQASRNS
ncbi:MAG: MFS transporter [Oscillospiraceae bacterium]|nr:MFS transporter [Oscillospiraceae bacterium]MDD4368811.1 MFS transporter [Oscillospiraceae bacterium]